MRVRTEGSKFEKPSDNYIHVVAQTSIIIPNARSNHCIIGTASFISLVLGLQQASFVTILAYIFLLINLLHD